MTRLVSAVLRGQPLRHRPIALRVEEQGPVRVVLEVAGREVDARPDVFPVALKPFTIGLYPGPGTDVVRGSPRCRLRFEDITDSTTVSWMIVEAGQTLASNDGPIQLMRPIRSAVPCVSPLYRACRHFLAWRHAQVGGGAHDLHLSYPDLCHLNAFYALPRPVFLVSVAADERSSMFPMDLVALVGADRYLLALRRTSPSVATMCDSRRIVVSGVPAALKDIAYRLGAHHQEASIDWAALPVTLAPSREYGIPRPADSPIIRELHIDEFHPIGSHMLFNCRIVSQAVPSDVPQLCHVSDMYARWRRCQDRAFVDA